MNALTEKELELIFSPKKRKAKSGLSLYLLYAIFAVILYLFFYFIANFPALMQKISWWYANDLSTGNQANSQIVETTNNGTVIIKNEAANKTADNMLFIPKLNITAPVAWNVENTDSIMQKTLETGTAHILGTALPGQKGNGFITGHSSNYLWARGNYKTVFSLLNKLVIGDQILLKYQNNKYVYRISKISTIKPSQNEILKQAKDKNEFSFMTCVPVGTSLYRLVVTGDQIYPKPVK